MGRKYSKTEEERNKEIIKAFNLFFFLIIKLMLRKKKQKKRVRFIDNRKKIKIFFDEYFVLLFKETNLLC